MLYITSVFVLATLVLFTRLYFLKKEIKRATNQLNQFNNNKTEKKVDIAFFDKDIEKLAIEINRQIDFTKLANEKKRRTENELKQAIANISHDIRTPMTSIIGYIQFLESNELTSEEKTEFFKIVKNRVMRLKVLLHDFFELSIIESADYPLKIEPVKLNNLVLEVLMGFYEEFNKRHFEPSIQIPKETISILSDSSAVKRVIENLVVNAIRHSSGNVTIRLEKKHSSVELIISNSVNQLNEKDIILLFDRFYKADQTRSEKSTGLGLSIAKSLMLKMNGDLSAELKDHQLYMKCEWKKVIRIK
ncbi:sensor histidine kinase [Peribacillus butanolivorans]|uniref:sensor histidine kinase n=1 Tax=Peribacillus butanolivorans TaxID=421767 RepID=UPI0037FCE372